MVVEQKTSGSKPISRIEAPNPANEDEISSTNHSNNEVKFVDQGCQTEKSAVNNGHTSNQTSQQQQETADQNPQSKGRFLKECHAKPIIVTFKVPERGGGWCIWWDFLFDIIFISDS